MNYIKAQATLFSVDNIIGDSAVNTFHFRTDGTGTPDQDAADVQTHLLTFFAAIDGQLSPRVKTTAGLGLKIYNHEDPTPRVPLIDSVNNLTVSAVKGLPAEVAVCLSYKATPISGQNPRRSRGRIYLGPVTQSAEASSGEVFVDSAQAQVFANAGFALRDWVGAIGGSEIWWSVFSRSDALGLAVGAPGPATEPDYTSSQLNLGYKAITTCYVDNAFDTQRRRGPKATTRYVGV